MTEPRSTGQAARILQTTEPRLAEFVRRGKIKPEPPIFAGRRLWSLEHILKAAELLGLAAKDLPALLDQSGVDAGRHGRFSAQQREVRS